MVTAGHMLSGCRVYVELKAAQYKQVMSVVGLYLVNHTSNLAFPLVMYLHSTVCITTRLH